jgi:hypothetical protein
MSINILLNNDKTNATYAPGNGKDVQQIREKLIRKAREGREKKRQGDRDVEVTIW